MHALSLFASLLLAASANAAPLDKSAPPDFVYKGDAPYDFETGALSSIMTCANQPNATSKAVLLVHGTGSTGLESWGDGYVPGLLSRGYTPCYLDLPNRSMDDMQDTSAYVAYNIHYLSSQVGGNSIAIVSHSQGGPDVQWALRFWPSTRAKVNSFVALSPDMSGVDNTSVLRQLCTLDLLDALGIELCSAALWQQARGSNYYAALNKDKNTWVPTTTIYSMNDTTVPPPQQNAHLPGGAISVAVQELCPLATTDHFGMLVDYAAFQLAMSAIGGGGGQANVNLVAHNMPDTTCSLIAAPGMTFGLVPALTSILGDLALGIILTGRKTPYEPPLKPYALLSSQ